MQSIPFIGSVFVLCLYLLELWLRHRKFNSFRERNRCKPPTVQPTSAFHKFRLVSQRYTQIFEDYYAVKFAKYGSTHAILDRFNRPKAIHTIDPVNLDAVLVSSREDWLVFENRRNALKPLAQGGVLTTDGEVWHRNRRFLTRRINNTRAKDTAPLEQDVGLFFQAIDHAIEQSETNAIDVSIFVQRLMLDMSSRFLLGVSTGFQREGISQAKGRQFSTSWSKLLDSYASNWRTLRYYITLRSALGSRYWLADGTKYRRACAQIRAFADVFIDTAKQRALDSDSPPGDSLVLDLITELKDWAKVREIFLELIIAAQNMTGSTLEWAIAELAEHPDVYARLRAEVIAACGTNGSSMTWKALQSCQTLQNVIMETLRCYPVVAIMSRTAGRDTVLPRGGGKDGAQPVAVPKGTTLTGNIYLLHRSESHWGRDAGQWKPDRWIGGRAGPEYLAFSAGPRVCLGKQISLTQLSYVLARIAQQCETIQPADGADNLAYQYRSILSPKNGVRVVLTEARSEEKRRGSIILPLVGVIAKANERIKSVCQAVIEPEIVWRDPFKDTASDASGKLETGRAREGVEREQVNPFERSASIVRNTLAGSGVHRTDWRGLDFDPWTSPVFHF